MQNQKHLVDGVYKLIDSSGKTFITYAEGGKLNVGYISQALVPLLPKKFSAPKLIIKTDTPEETYKKVAKYHSIYKSSNFYNIPYQNDASIIYKKKIDPIIYKPVVQATESRVIRIWPSIEFVAEVLQKPPMRIVKAVLRNEPYLKYKWRITPILK